MVTGGDALKTMLTMAAGVGVGVGVGAMDGEFVIHKFFLNSECSLFGMCFYSSEGWGRPPPLERHYSDYGGGGRRGYGSGWGGGGGGRRGDGGGGGRWGGGGGRGPDLTAMSPEEWIKPLPRQERLEA